MNTLTTYICNQDEFKYKYNSKVQLGNFFLRPVCKILNAKKDHPLFRIAALIAIIALTPLTLLGLAIRYWGEKTHPYFQDKESLKQFKTNPQFYVDKLYYPVIRREFLAKPAQMDAHDPVTVELPSELLSHIFTYLPDDRTKMEIREDLAVIACVCKEWHKLAPQARASWLNKKALSPRILGCRNIQERIQAIVNLKLLHEDLSALGNLSQENVNELTKQTTLLSLGIGLPENKTISHLPLAQFRNLTSFVISCGDYEWRSTVNYPEKELTDALSLLPLRKLHITWSNFTGEHLKDLPFLSQLNDLSLCYCKKILLEYFPVILSKLQEIEKIDLGSTYVTAAHLALLPHTQLKKVGLSGTELKEQEIRDFLSHCGQLEHLDLYKRGFKGATLSEVLPRLQHLTRLDWRCGHKLKSPAFYTALATVTSLKKLDISCGAELPDTVTALTSLTNLSVLKCSHGKICQILPSLISLRKLDISHTDATFRKPALNEIRVISRLTNLTSLILSGGEEWNPILSQLTRLKSLTIYSNYPASQNLPNLKPLTQLQKLHIRPRANLEDTQSLLTLPSLSEMRLFSYETRDSSS